MNITTDHQIAAICLGTFCLWVSLCLILRLWLVHSRAPLAKRLWWSVVLLVPLLGWLAYAGGFQIPDANASPCRENPSAGTGGSWE